MEIPEQIQFVALLVAMVGISVAVALLAVCWSGQRKVYRMLKVQSWRIRNGIKYYRQAGRLLPTRWRAAGRMEEDIHPQDLSLLEFCEQDWKQGCTRGCILRMRNPDTREYEHYIVRGHAKDGGYVGFLWSAEGVLKANESADRLDRLAMIGRMTTTVVHDINNQLGTIKAVVGVLGAPVEEEQKQTAIAHVSRAVDVGVHLSRNLMDFVREGQLSPKPSDVDANALLCETSDMLKMGLGRTISLTVEAEAACSTVVTTAEELRSVLVNLVLNAKDAMPRGGNITVCSLNREEYGKRYLVIQVRDTGDGIDEKKQQELFLPFYTSKPKGKGLGLGLMACKETMERYGGRIQVRSQLGEGATFELLFPLETELEEKDSQSAGSLASCI